MSNISVYKCATLIFFTTIHLMGAHFSHHFSWDDIPCSVAVYSLKRHKTVYMNSCFFDTFGPNALLENVLTVDQLNQIIDRVLDSPPMVLRVNRHRISETYTHLDSKAYCRIVCGSISGKLTMSEQANIIQPGSVSTDADRHNVYKIETVGDCYVAATGLVQYDPEIGIANELYDNFGKSHHKNNVNNMVNFAKDVLGLARARIKLGLRHASAENKLQVRIGIHFGDVVSGVIGKRMPRFCLFGDVMNTASRMETNCIPDSIQITHDVYELLDDTNRNLFERRPESINVKGKGEMSTYLYKGLTDAPIIYNDGTNEQLSISLFHLEP